MAKNAPAPAKSGGFKSKREEMRARRQRRQWIERLVIGAIVLAMIGGGAAYWAATKRPAAHPNEQSIVDEGRGHVPQDSALAFQNYPPTSGSHYPSTVEWGVYTTPIPEGNWVHNLEHGGIVLLYNCAPEGCADLEQELVDLAQDIPEDGRFQTQKIVITPYERPLEGEVVLLAWNHQLTLDSVDREAIINFYKRHVNRGPEVVR